MQAQLTQEQRIEVTKILKYLKGMENIIQTSPNPEQRERIGKDIVQYKDKLRSFFPEVDISNKNADAITSAVGFDTAPEEIEATLEEQERVQKLLPQLQIKKVSPNCNHSEINLIYTVLDKIDQIYWPILSKFCFELDYKYMPRLNALQLKLENVLRSVKSFAEIAEDKSIRQGLEAQKQLGMIKAHNIRKLLMEGDIFFKDVRSFLAILLEDMKIKKDIRHTTQQEIKNLKIRALLPPEEISAWESKTIYELISEFHQLCDEIIKTLSVPSIKAL